MGHQSIISPVVKSNRTVLNLSRPYLARGIPTDIPDDHRKPVGLRSVIRDIARFRSASTSTCTCKLTDNRRQYLGNAAANPIYPILYDHPDNPFCSPLFEVDSRSPTPTERWCSVERYNLHGIDGGWQPLVFHNVDGGWQPLPFWRLAALSFQSIATYPWMWKLTSRRVYL